MQLCRDPLWPGGKHWKATLRESTPLLGQERESWQWRSENVVNCGKAGNAMRDTLWNWDNLRHSSSSTVQVECCWKDKDQVLATSLFFLKHLYSLSYAILFWTEWWCRLRAGRIFEVAGQGGQCGVWGSAWSDGYVMLNWLAGWGGVAPRHGQTDC